MKDDVKNITKLRDMTGAGVMECKKALRESGGDLDKAVKIIHEQGFAKVEKRAGREAGAGLIESYVHNERIGVLVDIRAETDFVVRSEPFRKLAHELAMQVAAMAPADVKELLKQPYVKDESKTIEALISEVIAKVGENVKVNGFSRMEV
ncbi:MAG: translation elongation factor Ts [Candidatus Liptonbacteria bacterium]|nr:translation elongation factor Ts [Candidatus Liptonbacteria bacterium]